MTDRLFDPSALVKRYAEEPGTETVDELTDDADATVFITALSVITAAILRQGLY